MTKTEFEQVDRAIRKFGDEFWNELDKTFGEKTTNREWIVAEIVSILAKAGITLKVVKVEEGEKIQEFCIGTLVKVVNVVDDNADIRNVGRIGKIENVILDKVETGFDELYAVRFTDGIRHEPRHWTDLEAGLPENQSAHYTNELEAI